MRDARATIGTIATPCFLYFDSGLRSASHLGASERTAAPLPLIPRDQKHTLKIKLKSAVGARWGSQLSGALRVSRNRDSVGERTYRVCSLFSKAQRTADRLSALRAVHRGTRTRCKPNRCVWCTGKCRIIWWFSLPPMQPAIFQVDCLMEIVLTVHGSYGWFKREIIVLSASVVVAAGKIIVIDGS